MTDTIQDLLARVNIAEQNYDSACTTEDKALPEDVRKATVAFNIKKASNVLNDLHRQILSTPPQNIDDLARKSAYLFEFYTGMSLDHMKPEQLHELAELESQDRLLWVLARDAQAIAGRKVDGAGHAATEDGKPISHAA
jgi:hypothetical protein